MPDAMEPLITRTPFTPADLPDKVTLWFCPACGARINGSYNLEPARKRCTKTWHLSNPVRKDYVSVALPSPSSDLTKETP